MSPTYLRAGWIHDFEDEPHLFYYELDEERFATRSIEVFGHGRMVRASKEDLERDPMALPDQSIPPAEEINAAEDRAWEITAQQFEEAWRAASGDI